MQHFRFFIFLLAFVLTSVQISAQGGCDPFINNCSVPLIEFAEQLVSNPSDCKIWEGPCNKASGIWRMGNVNIGAMTSLNGYKLGVRGNIMTEQLKICKAVWCDYVFSDTFRLMPLDEVKTFVAANGHLPECTPEKAIANEGGILMEEETLNQQKKIEEIYLHLIHFQHRLDALDKTLPSLPSVSLSTIDDFAAIHEYPEISSENGADDVIQIECFQVKPAPDGIAGIVIGFGSGPYTLTWNGPSSGNMNNVWCTGGAIKIKNLIAGNYNLAVSNASGLIGTCSFTISAGNSNVCNIFSDPLCRQSIISTLKTAFDSPPECSQWNGAACSHGADIYREGNVAIGTDRSQSGYSLAVWGGIVTSRLRVELCETQGWCDYVFNKDYPLMSLLEIESFVAQNRHLPMMINQDEVTESGGFEMKRVKIEQQIKIEEAYLHLMSLDSKKKALQQKLNAVLDSN